MDEADFTDILEHLRKLVREADFADLDNTASIESSTLDTPKRRLETYLYMTINMLKERSGSQALNTYNRFERTLEIEKGGAFDGVTVVLTDAQREMYGVDKYSIHDMDDYASVIIELQKVLDEIKMEPEPPTNYNQEPSF